MTYLLYRERTRTFFLVLTVLLTLLLLLILLSLSAGPYHIPVTEVIEVVLGHHSRHSVIVVQLRLPRTVAAVLTGATLAVSGLLLQTVFSNPLVEPYTLGIASAAVLGTVLSLSTGLYFRVPGAEQVLAFVLALLTSLLLLALYQLLHLTVTQLLLLGISLSLLYGAVSAVLELYFTREVHAVFFTMLGRVSHCRWVHLPVLVLALVTAIIAGLLLSKPLNALLLGEEHCAATGYSARSVTLAVLTVTSLSVALTVSICGVVSFVGLVTPHIVRALVGGDHRYCVPLSAVLGGVLLLTSDIVARCAVPPFELPLSTVTTVFGVPFFIYVMLKLRYG